MTSTQILCIGVNHQTAPLAVREALCAVPPVRDPSSGHACPGIDEWVILATCNRLEIYAALAAGTALDAPQELLRAHFGLPDHDLAQQLYVYKDEAAVTHLLRVASGLDSLVLGEPQILGQVSRAFSAAQQEGSTGPVMRALFRAAIAAGKRVRNETAIGCNPASVPSVAISQARQTLGSLRDRRILLVGAGAMARTAVKALAARSYKRIDVANRTVAHAQALVSGWGGRAYDLDELPAALAAADVVLCATNAQHALITSQMVAGVMAGREQRPLLLMDLAVPRNIDPAVELVAGVTLVDMDHLRAELDESLIARRRQVPAAEAILAAEEARLKTRLTELSMRPVISELRRKAEAIRRREVARTMRHLGDVDEATQVQIDHLSRALVNQLLHEPTIRLRREANREQAQDVVETVRELFDLDLPEEQPAK
jgi:glutamyl-tRNA reductase